MKKWPLGLMLLLAIPFAAQAAQLTYADKEATVLKNEEIVSVLVSRDPEISVYAVAGTLGCRVFTRTIDEALAIQTKLATDPKAWLQCFGEFKTFGDRLLVETDRYSLGVKLAD